MTGALGVATCQLVEAMQPCTGATWMASFSSAAHHRQVAAALHEATGPECIDAEWVQRSAGLMPIAMCLGSFPGVASITILPLPYLSGHIRASVVRRCTIVVARVYSGVLAIHPLLLLRRHHTNASRQLQGRRSGSRA